MTDPLQGLTPEQFISAFPMMRGLSGHDQGRQVDTNKLIQVAQTLNEGEERQDKEEGIKLFTVYEARHHDDVYRWGIRHYKGNWHPITFDNEVDAQKECDVLTLQWLEGNETILIHSFKNCL